MAKVHARKNNACTWTPITAAGCHGYRLTSDAVNFPRDAVDDLATDKAFVSWRSEKDVLHTTST